MSERISRRIAAVVVAAVLIGAGVAIATPASAFTDPAELTITPGDATAENLGGITFSGECLPGSDSAELRWDIGSSPSTVPVTLDGSGAFSGLGPYFTGAAPGLGLAVTLDCLQGGSSIGSTFADAIYPDLGASVGGLGTLAMDAPFAPTYDCGTPVAPSTFASASITLYDPSDVELEALAGLPVPAGSASGFGTPASYGLAVGDTVALYLNCFVTSGGPTTAAGFRSYSVTIAAATPAAAPPAAETPVLAETGTEAARVAGPAALAVLLLLGGTATLLAARRRIAR